MRHPSSNHTRRAGLLLLLSLLGFIGCDSGGANSPDNTRDADAPLSGADVSLDAAQLTDIQPLDAHLDIHQDAVEPIDVELDTQQDILGPIDAEPDAEQDIIQPIDAELDVEQDTAQPIDAELDVEQDAAQPIDAQLDGARDAAWPIDAAWPTDALQDAQMFDVEDATPTPRPTLNEVVAVHAPGEHDWFELYAAEAMELTGCDVVDDNPAHARAPLDGLRVEAGGRLIISAVDEAIEGPSVPFKLGRSDSLTLRCDGEIVDHLSWEEIDAIEGLSQCRLPDGEGAWAPCEPTPGEENRAPTLPLDGTLFDSGRVVEVRVEMVEPDGWAQIQADAMAEAYHPARLTFDGYTLSGPVAIRTKGFSSLRAVWNDAESDRYSFKVDLDRLTEGQALFGEQKFVLNNGFNDPSYLREALSLEVLAAFGLPTPRWGFVDLYLDQEHMGLYLLVEVIDKVFLRERFEGDDEGDLYKPERPAGDLKDLGLTYAPRYVTAEIKTNEDTTDHAAFMGLIDAIHRGGDLAAALDIEAALRYLAANAALLNLDSYQGMGHNYYLYERAGQFTLLPWDYNLSFGRFNCGCAPLDLIDLLIDEPVCGPMSDRPLAPRLLEDPARLERYHDLLIALLEGPLSEPLLLARIDALSGMIRPYVQADERRFASLAAFEAAVAEVGSPPSNLMELIRLRGASIRAQLSGALPSEAGGVGNCGREGPGEHHPCGDGVCVAVEAEHPELCPRDCQDPPPGGDWCGDGICDVYERDVSPCPEDCP